MGWLTASRMRGLLSDPGLWVAGSTLALLPLTRAAPVGVWLAAGLMAMAGVIHRRPEMRAWRVSSELGAAGALVWALAARAPLGLALVAALGAWIAASLLAGFARRHPSRGLFSGLFAISVLGVYSTVPDTEEALVLSTVSVVVGLLSLFAAALVPGRAGAGASATLFVWTVAVGGIGRAGSVVGAVGCLGIFLAEPLLELAAPVGASRKPGASPPRILWFALHTLCAVVCGRVAGLREGAVEAAAIVVPVLLSLTVLLWLFRRSGGGSGVP